MNGRSESSRRNDQPLPRIGAHVAPTSPDELPDLTLAESDGSRLRQGLVGGCIQIALPDDGPAVHGGLVTHIGSKLAGRGAVVWQDGNVVNITFGVFSHSDRIQVEHFAEQVARRLGASVALATTIGLVAPADATFLHS